MSSSASKQSTSRHRDSSKTVSPPSTVSSRSSAQLNLRAITAEVESSLYSRRGTASSSSKRVRNRVIGASAGEERIRDIGLSSDSKPSKRNRGVKERSERDDRERRSEKKTRRHVRRKLEEKAKIYDEMERRRRAGSEGHSSRGEEVSIIDEFGRVVRVKQNSSNHYAFLAREAHEDRLRKMKYGENSENSNSPC
mmetsp:Transcript_36585/g.85513  ORF Transcript_36585/g.85513 Transcript_36585/m.85513 type:complete len:195 (-) Transcript_36585:58-642(-)